MRLVVISLLTLVTSVAPDTGVRAEETSTIRASQLVPETVVLYAEIISPADVISGLLDHPLRSRLESHEVFRNATQTQDYRNFLTGRKFFELQMGLEWREAITAITEKGIAVAWDPVSRSAALLLRGRDAAVMNTVRSKLLELTRLGQQDASAEQREYRGIPVYRIDQGGAAVVGEWLIFANRPELGKAILDRLLDESDQPRSVVTDSAGSLDSHPGFQTARAARADNLSAWAFVSVESLRQHDRFRNSLQGQAPNPLVELIAGGIQSTLQQTPYVTAELASEASTLRLSAKAPWDRNWIPEQRTWYFGPDPGGPAPALPVVPGTLLTIGTWRDVSEMWLRSGDLFSEQMNDELASADNTLTTLFAGRDFGTDILGSFLPQMGLIVTRQDFGQALPQPAIRLPAFALVLQLRDPEKMTRELRRTFQSMIGFFNVVGAMEGRPQLEMDVRRLDGGEVISSVYIPEEDDQDSTTAPLIFNFSPSVGFAGSRFVISSSQKLAEQLVQAPLPPSGPDRADNTHVALDAAVLQQVLADNREQLISQNMLTDGNSREEAETQVGLLLEAVGLVRSAGLSLKHDATTLELRLQLTIRKENE